MIGRLRGTVVSVADDGSCVVDVGGVGYELFVPLGMLGRMPKPPEEATFEVHTHVREDAIVLYGFATPEDRAAFRTVLSVSGIGPKIALSILSSLRADELALAVSRGDAARFKGISGVGKKIVERLLLELRDKLPVSPIAPRPAPEVRPAPPSGPLHSVASALVQMGYKPSEAERAVARIEAPEGKEVAALLREALSALA